MSLAYANTFHYVSMSIQKKKANAIPLDSLGKCGKNEAERTLLTYGMDGSKDTRSFYHTNNTFYVFLRGRGGKSLHKGKKISH